MKIKNKMGKKILSVILTVLMVISIIPLSTSAVDSIKKGLASDREINFAVMSDMHYYPASLAGNYNEAFMKSVSTSIAREPYQSVGLVDSALAGIAEHAKENGIKYLVLSGDLTSNGEYEAHRQLAARLEKFEKDTGIQVIAINGNHDINKAAATTYESGEAAPARRTTPEEFLELYKNLGYDLAYHRYVPSNGKANMLSYSVRADGYRFIAMDTGKYSSEVTKDGTDLGETSGCFTDEALQWVLDEIADAKANGETVIGVSHHNFVPHYDAEYTIIRGFVIDGWEEITDKLTDAGMHFSFTGHIHDSDIAQTVTDDGETLTEICCDSLTAFPNYFREVSATTDVNGKTTMNVESQEVDCVLPVTVNGETYETPYRIRSLGDTFFDETGLSGTAVKLIGGLLEDYSAKFGKKGVVNALKDMGLDIEGMIGGFFGDGLKIGDTELFTTKNLMGFIEDLLNQIYENYMTDPAATTAYLGNSINKLLNVKMSDLPNTRFIDEYGFGDKTKPGTFEDFLECVIVYKYEGKLHMKDDPFMMDALDNLNNGDTVFDIFNVLLDIVSNDLLQDKILKDLDLNLGAFFPKGTTLECVGSILAVTMMVIFLGDTSYLNVSNKILTAANKLGLVDFKSLWGIVEHYMDEYLTDTQLEGVGQTLANIACEFAYDDNYTEDVNTTVVYDGKVVPEATRENYRLPTVVSTTLGADQSSRNVSWYTKTSVKGTDIEIIPYSENPVFTGKTAVPYGVKLNTKTVRTERQFPGVDLGVLGIMNYEFPMNRHIVEISGLQAGKTYLYRVGDASRNWWSEVGTFKMADGSGDTTFIHVCDPQSQSAQQYATFATVLEKAYELYDSDFIVNTGDNVDHGDNFRQWQWMFNTASDTLMDTVMMSASGNHEGKGSYAIEKNYYYSNVPEQDTESGIYFSFDYNNVHVAILNTQNLDDDDSLNDAQVDWLIDDMENSDADWKFVAFHKAMYSNGSHYKDDDVCAIRDELCTLMPQLGIDMVFQGHDHVYLRTDSMIDNKVESVTTSTVEFNGKEYTVKENPVGTVYEISGCSGVKVYNQKDESLTDKYFPRAEVIKNVTKSVFSGINIVGDTLYFDAYTVDVESGETENIDSFAIRKDLSVRKGTGVQQSIDWMKLFSKIVSVIIPVIKTIISRVFECFSLKIW